MVVQQFGVVPKLQAIPARDSRVASAQRGAVSKKRGVTPKLQAITAGDSKVVPK